MLLFLLNPVASKVGVYTSQNICANVVIVSPFNAQSVHVKAYNSSTVGYIQLHTNYHDLFGCRLFVHVKAVFDYLGIVMDPPAYRQIHAGVNPVVDRAYCWPSVVIISPILVNSQL